MCSRSPACGSRSRTGPKNTAAAGTRLALRWVQGIYEQICFLPKFQILKDFRSPLINKCLQQGKPNLGKSILGKPNLGKPNLGKQNMGKPKRLLKKLKPQYSTVPKKKIHWAPNGKNRFFVRFLRLKLWAKKSTWNIFVFLIHAKILNFCRNFDFFQFWVVGKTWKSVNSAGPLAPKKKKKAKPAEKKNFCCPTEIVLGGPPTPPENFFFRLVWLKIWGDRGYVRNLDFGHGVSYESIF